MERLNASLGVDGLSGLMAEREGLKPRLEQLQQEAKALQKENRQHSQRVAATIGGFSERSEISYLHIIGAMMGLSLGRSPSGLPYSSFKSQEAVISALVAHHGARLGISERTLYAKFAAAKHLLKGNG